MGTGNNSMVVPIVLSLSLCGLTGFMLYLLLRKEDNKHSKVHSSNTKSKELKIPYKHVHALIGRSGSNIKEIQEKSATRINFRETDVTDKEGNKTEKVCVIRGEPSAVQLAEVLIQESLSQITGAHQVVMSVPGWAAGKIIGRGGENIRDICHTSGARVKLESSKDGDMGPAAQKQVTITGNTQQITLAQDIINQCIMTEKKRREEESTRREPRGQYAGSNRVKKTEPDQHPDVSGSGALLEVFVSAVSSPSRFWLQIVGSQVEKLDKLVDLMTEYYSLSQNRELHKLSDVQVGQLVAAVFRHDGKWYRAKVAEIKPNEFDNRQRVCDVHFVDYGDNEYVALNELVGLRTDMLQLRFQAVECFLAGVAPKDGNKWDPKAIERFEELSQVARWKRLWSRTCTFREKPVTEGEGDLERNKREGSPIPGVKLYDVRDGVDIDIGSVLVEEDWGVEVEEEPKPSPLPQLAPTTPTPTLMPPTFGDLQSSRVLGMVVSNTDFLNDNLGREERSVSLPHSPSPITPPVFERQQDGDGDNLGDRSKSLSLAGGIDFKRPAAPVDLTNATLQIPTNLGEGHMNGSHHINNNTSVEDVTAFIHSEKRHSTTDTKNLYPTEGKTLTRSADSFTKVQPIHIPDPKDELKAKMNRVDSHHGNLEALGRSTPPKVLSTPK